MLWKAHTSDFYLLGTMHVLDRPLEASHPTIGNAYRLARRVVCEAELPVPIPQQYLLNPPDDSLRNKVPVEVFASASRDWEECGLKPEDLDRCLPWFAMMQIGLRVAARDGIKVEYGVDETIKSWALRDGKPVSYFEEFEETLRGFIHAPPPEQVAFLQHAIRIGTDMRPMVKAWHEQDVVVFEAMLAERHRTCPKAFGMIDTDRNIAWLPKVLRLAADRIPTLIVVGAFHCVSERGLPALLVKAGLPMSRV